MITAVDASDWLAFLEARLADSRLQVQLLIGILGVLPAGAFGWIPSATQNVAFAVAIVGIISTLSALLTIWLANLLITRRGILILMDLVLSGLLVTPAEIAEAYHILGRYALGGNRPP